MQAPAPSFLSRPVLCRLALILATGCALAACDKHSASEVPESYGHGSARRKSYTDHQADSSLNNENPRHYSDTQGTVSEATEKKADGQPPTPAAAGTPGGHLF